MARRRSVRERILNEALGQFVAKGYGAISVRELIEPLGISKGGFYHHFASKEELLVAVVERVLSEWVNSVARLTANSVLTVEARMRALFLSPLERGGYFYALLYEGLRESSYLRTRTKGVVEELVKHCEELLRAGQSRGEIRDFLDCEGWAFQIAATIEGGTVLAAFGGVPNLKEQLQRSFENTWRGVKALAI